MATVKRKTLANVYLVKDAETADEAIGEAKTMYSVMANMDKSELIAAVVKEWPDEQMSGTNRAIMVTVRSQVLG